MKLFRLLTHLAIVFLLLFTFPLYAEYGTSVCQSVGWTSGATEQFLGSCSGGGVVAGGIFIILIGILLVITIWHFFSPEDFTDLYKD